MSVLSACMTCTMFMPGVCGGQKRLSDSLELKLVRAVSCLPCGSRELLSPLQEQLLWALCRLSSPNNTESLIHANLTQKSKIKGPQQSSELRRNYTSGKFCMYFYELGQSKQILCSTAFKREHKVRRWGWTCSTDLKIS